MNGTAGQQKTFTVFRKRRCHFKGWVGRPVDKRKDEGRIGYGFAEDEGGRTFGYLYGLQHVMRHDFLLNRLKYIKTPQITQDLRCHIGKKLRVTSPLSNSSLSLSLSLSLSQTADKTKRRGCHEGRRKRRGGGWKAQFDSFSNTILL